MQYQGTLLQDIRQTNNITIPSDNFRPVSYRTRGHEHHFQHLQCNCDSYRYSFFPSVIRLWNSLPLGIVSCNDFNKFDQNLKIIFVLIKFYICVILLDEGLHINHK